MTANATLHALIQDLNIRLSAGARVTETLLAWCDEHGLSKGPISVECCLRQVLVAVPDEVSAALAPTKHETVHFRQVRIMRGPLPLAMAENWFVPQRLAAGMSDVLQTTRVPFGTVIAPLRPSRRILAAQVRPIRSALCEDWSRHTAAAHPLLSTIILEHEAVICSGTGAVLACVKEKFFSELVAFAASEPARQVVDERSRAESVMQHEELEP
ncbi:hypothetical protein [Microvirga sp. VF16]|uniref:hypothetical protein n=1 Tax=Microvirga sp. VF16 TaxID=2807101 RepID=UPI00193C9D73|nr:hypothetical protein [Microvirga sp. VF16]QRM32305.1 hypothetical protein JO965_29725 [Microvirga sp. VF16]